MSSNNVVPFRKRPPSASELDAYRRMTRNWSDEMRRLMFPSHFQADQQRDSKKR